jgi:hypothetical protein
VPARADQVTGPARLSEGGAGSLRWTAVLGGEVAVSARGLTLARGLIWGRASVAVGNTMARLLCTYVRVICTHLSSSNLKRELAGASKGKGHEILHRDLGHKCTVNEKLSSNTQMQLFFLSLRFFCLSPDALSFSNFLSDGAIQTIRTVVETSAVSHSTMSVVIFFTAELITFNSAHLGL